MRRSTPPIPTTHPRRRRRGAIWRRVPYLIAAATLLSVGLAAVSTSTALAQTTFSDGDLTLQPAKFVPTGGLEFTPGPPGLKAVEGTFAPSVEFDVLPAVRKFGPKVSIAYSASRSNGPLGAGWGLSSRSTIERRSRTKGVSQHLSSDLFLVDGTELVPLPDGTYRALYDAFTVYSPVYHGPSLTGWIAAAEGQTITWGDISPLIVCTPASDTPVEFKPEADPATGTCAGQPVRWHKSAAEDDHGNRISYAYTTLMYGGGPSHQRALDHIRYNDLIAPGSHHEIRFDWISRDDVRASRADGMARVTTHLLGGIRVRSIRSGATTTTHHYALNYEEAACDQQSVLRSVVQLGLDPSGAPTGRDRVMREFSYADGETPSDCPSPWSGTPVDVPLLDQYGAEAKLPRDNSKHTYRYGSTLADVNGDSRPDFLVLQDFCGAAEFHTPFEGQEGQTFVTCERKVIVHINTLDASHAPSFVKNSELSDELSNFVSNSHARYELLDFNRDGYLDVAQYQDQPGGTWGLMMGGPDKWDTASVTKPWFTKASSYMHSHPDHQYSDLNGDGYVDIVFADRVYWNSGKAPFYDAGDYTTFDDPVLVYGGSGAASFAWEGGLPSDCLQQSHPYFVPRSRLGVKTSTGGLYPSTARADKLSPKTFVWQHTRHTDVDGDGITDRVVRLPILRQNASDTQLFGVDAATCGAYDQVFLGNGSGGFEAAGYGVGGPSAPNTIATMGEAGVSKVSYDIEASEQFVLDFDGNGRADFTQYCTKTDATTGAITTALVAMPHRGVDSATGGDLGFGASLDGACPDKVSEPLPIDSGGFITLEPQSGVFKSVLDIDGDALPDGFEYNGQWEPGSYNYDYTNEHSVRWWRNQRAIAQNRLVEVRNGRGGATNIAWDTSARGENHIPLNVPTVAETVSAQGKTTYVFKAGAYADATMLGFGEAHTTTSDGATEIQVTHRSVVLRGKPIYQALLGADGALRRLTAHIHLNTSDPRVGMASLAEPWASYPLSADPSRPGPLDVVAPYFNPLVRTCEFNFGVSALPPGGNLDTYLARCDEFVAEEPALHPQTGATDAWAARGWWAVVRGASPESVTPYEAAWPTLRLLEKALDRGLSMDELEATQAGQLNDPILGEQHYLTAEVDPNERASSAYEVPQNGDPVPPMFSIVAPPGLVDAGYRFKVLDTDYDHTIAKPVRITNYKDISTLADTSIQTLDYYLPTPPMVALDGIYDWAQLKNAKTFDYTGVNLLGHRRYQAYAQGEPIVEEDIANDGSGSRTRTKALGTGGYIAYAETWGGTSPKTMTLDACGEVLRTTGALGSWTETVRDTACRPLELKSSAAPSSNDVIEAIERNDFGDPTLKRVFDAPNPVHARRLVQDYHAASTTPALVESVTEDDGSETVTKTYLDRYHRTRKSVVCKRAGSGATWDGEPGTHLDQFYSCDIAASDPVAQSLTLRYADTGRIALTTAAYDPRDSAPIAWTGTAYDEWGRVVVRRHPDGERTLSNYGLEVEKHVSPLGIETVIHATTVQTRATVDGMLRERRVVDAQNKLTHTSDGNSKTTEYVYNGYGELAAKRSPHVEVWSPAGPVWARPTTTLTRYPSGRVWTMTDPNGNVWTYEYDAIGRRKKTIGPDSVVVETVSFASGAPPARSRTVTDAAGATVVTTLSTRNKPLTVTDIDGTTTHGYDTQGRAALSILPHGAQNWVTYDRLGRVFRTSLVEGMNVSTSETLYDIRGNVVTTIDGDGVVQSQSFDIADRMLTATVGEGGMAPIRLTERRGHDADGRVVLQETSGHLRTFALDSVGRVETEYVGGDATTALYQLARGYDGADRLLNEENGTGDRVEFTYDALGRMVNTEHFDAGGASLGLSHNGFDAAGNLLFQADADGVVTTFVVDAYQRLHDSVAAAPMGTIRTRYAIGVASPLGGSPTLVETTKTVPVKAGVDEVVRTYTDAKGRVVYHENPDGSATQNVYVAGRLTQTVRYRDDGSTQSVKPVGYRPQSMLVSEVWPDLAPSDVSTCLASPSACPRTNTDVGYTPGGRLAHIVDGQGNVTQYVYEPGSGLLRHAHLGGVSSVEVNYEPTVARRSSVVLGLGSDRISTTLTYLSGSSLVESTYRVRPATGKTENTITTYDGAGRVATQKFQRSTTALFAPVKTEAAYAFNYDGRGRISTKSYSLDDGAYAGSIAHSWTDAGRAESVTYPSGRIALYHWAGPVLDRIEGIDAGGGARDIAHFSDHDLTGRAWTVTSAPGLTQELATHRYWGAMGREEWREIHGMSMGIRREVFSYDGIGRLEQIDVTEGGTAAMVRTYGYTPDDMVTNETATVSGLTATRNYVYDNAGLRTATEYATGGPAVTSSMIYGPGHKLANVDGAPIAWDDLGRQLNDQRGQDFGYGLANQLVEVTAPSSGAVVEVNLHDGVGQRVARRAGGATHFYLPGAASGQVLVHVLPSGDVEETIYTPSGSVVARVVSDGTPGGEIRPVASNITGSPYREASSSGTYLERDATAFGEPMLSDGLLSTELGFHQMWTSAAAGIHTAGVRSYDPETGRFLSPDPLTYAAAPDVGSGADFFRYARNNPVALQDANGYRPIGIVDGMAMDRFMYQGFEGADGGGYGGDLMNFMSRGGESTVFGDWDKPVLVRQGCGLAPSGKGSGPLLLASEPVKAEEEEPPIELPEEEEPEELSDQERAREKALRDIHDADPFTAAVSGDDYVKCPRGKSYCHVTNGSGFFSRTLYRIDANGQRWRLKDKRRGIHRDYKLSKKAAVTDTLGHNIAGQWVIVLITLPLEAMSGGPARSVSTRIGKSLFNRVFSRLPGWIRPAARRLRSIIQKGFRKTPCCFVEGTLVLAFDGPRAIEDLQPGDLVWARDHEGHGEDSTAPGARQPNDVLPLDDLLHAPAEHPVAGAPIVLLLGPVERANEEECDYDF